MNIWIAVLTKYFSNISEFIKRKNLVVCIVGQIFKAAIPWFLTHICMPTLGSNIFKINSMKKGAQLKGTKVNAHKFSPVKFGTKCFL